jgi:hypothetical protein
MKKTLRFVAATLLLAASVSAAYSKSMLGLSEGPAPVPLCDPRDPKCKMPIPTQAPGQR